MDGWMDVCMYVRTNVSIYLSTYVSMYLCIYVCTNTTCTYPRFHLFPTQKLGYTPGVSRASACGARRLPSLRIMRLVFPPPQKRARTMF